MTAKSIAPELRSMVDAACADTASEADLLALSTALADSPEAQQYYLKYCRMHVELFFCCGEERLNQSILDDIRSEASVSPVAPLPTIVANPVHPTFSYLSSGWPVAYLIATVIFGIGLAIGAIVHVSRPVQVVSHSTSANPKSPIPNPSSVVARITGMVDCVWESGQRSAISGQQLQSTSRYPLATNHSVSLGDTFALRSGMLELTYDTGAKVILQGPVTYEVESPSGGYLSVGKLTAKLEKTSVVSGQRSESANHQSEILNHKSLSPVPCPLFSVRTPTALVTDLGTEFGVEVDKSGATQSHVFRGSIRIQRLSADGTATDAGHVLHENQSARITGDGVSEVAVAQCSKPSGFIRRIPKPSVKTLDLVDVVAGGDGFSGLRGRGIDPTNGQPTATPLVERKDANPTEAGWARFLIAGDGKYHRVEALPLVDGVFIPDGRSGAVQVDSAGHVLEEFGNTSGTTGLNVWAGGSFSVPSSAMSSEVASLLPSASPSRKFGRTRLGGIDYAASGHGLIFLHANGGITFNLEAIRRANPRYNLLRFRAAAGNTEPVSEKGIVNVYADVRVLVDGEVRFQRREINGCTGAFPIVLPIVESDRFLTLVATDGGNGIGCDWIVFGDPVLELSSVSPRGKP